MHIWGDRHEQLFRLEHVDAGCGSFEDGYIHNKTVPFYIIAEAIEGTYIVNMPGRTLKATNGQVYIAPANTPLEIVHLALQGKSDMLYRYAHLRFSYMGVVDLFELYELPCELPADATAEVTSIIQRLLTIKEDAQEPVFSAWIQTTELAFRMLHVLLQSTIKKTSYEGKLAILHELQPVLIYIRENLHERLDIDWLLRLFPYSRSSFFALFRNYLGQTPMEYIKTVRLNEALHKLSSTMLSIGQIADETGFTNSFHFSREFKARFGVPPSQARNENRIW